MSRRDLRHRGMLLAEMLIGVAITTMLLTAMSGVLLATAKSIRTNDEFAKASQAARQATARMTRDVRVSDACQVGTSDMQGASRITNGLLQIVTVDGHSIDYRFDVDNRTLTMSVNESTPAVLVRNVTGQFTSTVINAGDGARQTMSVGMTLHVSAGPQKVTLNGSAAPRRSIN